MPSLAATAGQDLAAVGGLHALAEAVYRLAAAAMGLECAFHALCFFTLRDGTGRTIRCGCQTPGHHTRGCERTAKLGKITIPPNKSCLQRDMLGTNGLAEEKARLFVEGGRVVGGAIAPASAFGMVGQSGPHLGVPLEIVGQPIRHNPPLFDDAHMLRQVSTDEGCQHGIMGAGQHDGIDGCGTAHEPVQAVADEMVCPGVVIGPVFDKGYPHGAILLVHLYVGEEPSDLDRIRFRPDRAGGTEDANIARARMVPDDFRRGTDHAQHSVVGGDPWQVALLDGAQGLRRGGIAGEDHQRASFAEHPFHRFECVAVDGVEGTGAVWRTGIVTQIEVVVPRQSAEDLAEHGEAAVSRVEDADGSLSHAGRQTEKVACGNLFVGVCLLRYRRRHFCPAGLGVGGAVPPSFFLMAGSRSSASGCTSSASLRRTYP